MKIAKISEPYYLSKKKNDIVPELNHLIEYQLALSGDSSILHKDRIGFFAVNSTENGNEIAMSVGETAAELQASVVINNGKGIHSVAANTALHKGGSVIITPYCGINKASIAKSFWSGLGPEDMERLLCISVYEDDENWSIQRARRSDECVAQLSTVAVCVEPMYDYSIKSYIDRAYKATDYLKLIILLPEDSPSIFSEEIFTCENIKLVRDYTQLPDAIKAALAEE